MAKEVSDYLLFWSMKLVVAHDWLLFGEVKELFSNDWRSAWASGNKTGWRWRRMSTSTGTDGLGWGGLAGLLLFSTIFRNEWFCQGLDWRA
jgi:hypothetical protein